MAPVQRPYGLWDSPLQPADLAETRQLRDVAWDSDGRTLVWVEGRGKDGVLVARTGLDAPRDLNPTRPTRGQVGYGGGDFAVSRGRAYFVAQDDGRLCVQPIDHGKPTNLTPAFGGAAAPAVAPNGRWVAYVHSVEGTDSLAVVGTAQTQWPQRLASGADFYMQPVWDRGSRRLAWVEWDHPRMPWEGSRLMLADLAAPAGSQLPRVRQVRQVAGGPASAVFQPAFAPDGRSLAFAADAGGWSRLHLLDLESGAIRCLTADDHDVAQPAWQQGMRTHAFAAAGDQLFYTRAEDGARRAYCCRLADGQVTPAAGLEGYTWVEQLAAAPRGTALAAIVSTPDRPTELVTVDRGRLRVHARTAAAVIAPAQASAPRSLCWAAANGDRVHGLYYPPASTTCTGVGLPPLLVNVHGGPTSQSTCAFDARSQFFATRGWAVLQVNHRGSSGYGRAYLEALRGNWGLHDVEDTVSGARHLVAQGLAAADRLVVMGGSAGGYTVLRTLTAHPGLFRAGICLYGISNLFSLADQTHKFEARYLDWLLGPLPEASAVYRERSPLYAADRLQDPVAIFQGTDDKVVPPAQAEQIVASLRARGVPHEYHLYPNEGHGWRQPATVEAFWRAVDRFLRHHVLLS